MDALHFVAEEFNPRHKLIVSGLHIDHIAAESGKVPRPSTISERTYRVPPNASPAPRGSIQSPRLTVTMLPQVLGRRTADRRYTKRWRPR